MEASAADWFSDPEMDDPINQWELSSLDHEFTTQDIWEGFQQTLSSESYTSNTFCGSSMESSHITGCVEGPGKIPKTNSWSSSCTPTPRMLTFGNPDSPSDNSQLYGSLDGSVKPMEVMRNKRMVGDGSKQVKVAGDRQTSYNHEHVIAERKRREKITQRFIALSAIVPGLKKTDKASILTDAIKYLKQMQEKVKTLEDQAVKETMESAVLVKKSQHSIACNESIEGRPSGENLPEIKVRLSGKIVLVKIHCENRKGVLVKALSDIENLHLTVVNTSAIPFSGSSLDITVMANVEEGFSMTVKDLVKKLNSSLREFMQRN